MMSYDKMSSVFPTHIDLIIESYKDKPDKDVYFPKYWRDRYGNNKVDQGWES